MAEESKPQFVIRNGRGFMEWRNGHREPAVAFEYVAEIERLRRNETAEATETCRTLDVATQEIHRLRAALVDIRDECIIQGMSPALFAQKVLRGAVETAGSPSTHEAVESAISQSKNRDAKWGESVHPRTPVLNGEIVPDQPTTPPGREHRWHFVDGQYKCWDCPATFEFWQNGPPMRVAGPEASGEATGPEGDDSNMGTAPTSGPEATSSQGNAVETTEVPHIMAALDRAEADPVLDHRFIPDSMDPGFCAKCSSTKASHRDAPKTSAPLCSCGHDGRPGPGHQTNCPQYREHGEKANEV